MLALQQRRGYWQVPADKSQHPKPLPHTLSSVHD